MKNSLAFIVGSILGTKDTKILEEESSGQIILTIVPKQENIGKLIGKKGKIINAIRKLIKIRATKEGKKILLKILENSQKEKGSVLAENEAGAEVQPTS